MDVVVACPSYHRPHVRTLERYPRTRVYVDEAEFDDYVAANPEGSDIVAVESRWQGNTSRIRNRILDLEFKRGADAVLMIDDDMDAVCRHQRSGTFGYERKKLDEGELLELAEMGSILCEEWGYRFWGVNCVLDPKAYMQTTPFNTTKFIGGPFQCHLRNGIRYDESLPLKEDYDITLQHLMRYRGALRLNMYYYVCDQANSEGGCAVKRNVARERQQFEALQAKWGSKIIRRDAGSRRAFDFNPIMRSPIRGV